jgi:hypothetical protein
MSIAQDPIKCGICGKPITLEGVKVSAEGKPVHEQCLVAKIRLSRPNPALID